MRVQQLTPRRATTTRELLGPVEESVDVIVVERVHLFAFAAVLTAKAVAREDVETRETDRVRADMS